MNLFYILFSIIIFSCNNPLRNNSKYKVNINSIIAAAEAYARATESVGNIGEGSKNIPQRLEKNLDVFPQNLLINNIDNNKDTLLHLACKTLNIELINRLLREESEHSIINSLNNNLETPLHKALRSNNLTGNKLLAVKILLEHGANPNSEDKNKETPLYIALELADEEIINLFI